MMGTIQCSKCHTGTQAWLSKQANQSQMVGTIRPKCHTGTVQTVYQNRVSGLLSCSKQYGVTLSTEVYQFRLELGLLTP